jgi:hypothetical protein
MGDWRGISFLVILYLVLAMYRMIELFCCSPVSSQKGWTFDVSWAWCQGFSMLPFVDEFTYLQWRDDVGVGDTERNKQKRQSHD